MVLEVFLERDLSGGAHDEDVVLTQHHDIRLVGCRQEGGGRALGLGMGL